MALALVLLAWSGWDAAPAAAQTQTSGRVLEEIVVTAQRRVENVQDVPISVTPLDAEFLIEQDVRSLQDLNGLVPNLYTTNTVNYGAAPLSIRGIGGANGGGNFFNDEPVAVYVDGVYIGRLSFSTADLVDIGSIQVLRGPQGTLYGRNSTAGALLIESARPTGDFGLDLRARVAEFGERHLSLAVSGPFSDTVAGRLALGYGDRDGWGDNLATGEDVNGSEDRTVRGSLRFTPSDSLTLDLIAEYMEREADPATLAVAEVAPGVPTSPFVRRDDFDALLDDNEFALNDPLDNESETTSLNATLSWDFGGLTLDSITAFRSYELDGAQDSDSTGATLFNNNGRVESDQFSQELRLSSSEDNRLSWLAGVYFFTEDATMDFEINNFQGLFGAGTSAVFDASQDLSSWAAFGDLSFAVTDRFTLTVGARYSFEDKDFDNDQIVTTISDSFPLPVPFGPFPAGAVIPGGIVFVDPPIFVDDADFDNFSPRLVLDYAFTPDVLGYASFSQGFKSGGFNSFGLAPAFEEEEVDAFEIGIKSTLLDSRLRLNAALFSYDYTNLQVRRPVPTGGVTIQNAGEADVSGLEVEAVLVATDRLQFSANVSLLDTELNEFQTEQVPPELLFLIGAPIPLDPVNAAGNELTRAPELQYYVDAEYSFPLGDTLAGAVQLAFHFQDEVFFLETNQDAVTFAADDHGELDLRLTLSSNDDVWEVYLYGQNLTDERVVTQVTALGAFPNAAINEPRKYGAGFRYSWR